MFRLADKFQFHPITLSVSIADGLRWYGGGGWCYEEKMDGVRTVLTGGKLFGRSRAYPFQAPASLNTCQLDGELVRGVFYAFDIPVLYGQDLRKEPLYFRKQALRDLLKEYLGIQKIKTVSEGHGGEFLQTVISHGGEGIVAKRLDSLYGEAESWVKCKRSETFDCIITEKHSQRQSVRLGESGWCAVIGRHFDLVQIGDVVEIECHSRTASGKFREPRFKRLRSDKPACECRL